MSDSPAASAPRPGLVVLGVGFIIVWILVHVGLLWLSFAGGVLLDLALELFKTLTLPGLVINSPGMEMAWALPLQIGIGLTGAAGIPAGLAFFWRNRRARLWLTFGGLFLVGLAFDLYAVFRLFTDSFAGLS